MPDGTRTKPLPFPDNILQRLERQPCGCLRWTGHPNEQNYGRVAAGNGKNVYVHVAYYEMMVGPVPDGMVLDHICQTQDETCNEGNSCMHRLCVEPTHPEVVTPSENAKRARVGRLQKNRTHCPAGHEYNDENTHIDKTGRRHCRRCWPTKARARYRKSACPGLGFTLTRNRGTLLQVRGHSDRTEFRRTSRV